MTGRTLGILLLVGLIGTASAAELSTMTVQPETVTQWQSYYGVVEAVNRSTVAAQISGVVTAINYDVEDLVPKDALILTIDDSQAKARLAEAKANVAEAQAGLGEARVSFQRVQDLYKRKATSKAEFDQAQAAYQAARARLEAARAAVDQAQTQLGYTRVTAPYAGIVVQRHVEVGEMVQPGTPLMTGLSLEKLRINIQVPQAQAEAVRKAGRASVELPGGSRLTSDNLTFYPYADEQSHTFRVRINLPQDGHGLYPGMMLKVYVPLGDVQQLTVPRSAVVFRSELRAVYVLEDGRPRLRQIRLGSREGERIQVLAGLSPGEHVVLDPDAALKAIAAREGAHE